MSSARGDAMNGDPVVVIGAGPAGLTAAYELVKSGDPVVVAEADDVVGGISRTVLRDGWRFDIGGHRFFTKVRPVEALWHEILPGDDFLLRPRKSRIYYEGKYYDYPLRPLNALRNMGPAKAFLCGLSYLSARLRPPKDQTNYEGWLVARFGWRLYRTFFKTYTEKVWGIPVADMPADFAAQRVKNLDLGKAILNALTPRRNQTEITTLIEEFRYPKYGPGMMWEVCRDKVEAAGGDVRMQTAVRRIHLSAGRAEAVSLEHRGETSRQPASHVISSMPMAQLVRAIDPPPPAAVLAAADDLHYRDFLTVAVVVPEELGFEDNWIYVHSPEVKVGRIQNFGSWSPYMVKEGRTCLGLEYFVFEGDGMWTMPDEELIALASRELEVLGLVPAAAVQQGYVVRVPKAYPTYDFSYQDNVATIVAWLATDAANVHPVGRNGMHKYNNQDHSMYTAMLTVENIHGAHHDIWAVNVEQEYHEERREDDGAAGVPAAVAGGTGRDAPVLPRRVNP
ncbi:MAG TPA: NAD(P)/FAD-dependent oxidoreductase [Acidimicrobiales bacterium]|nr:NAD(P)/FAD-dependent oxidoreductase [Acidimicrobiales bacterium]